MAGGAHASESVPPLDIGRADELVLLREVDDDGRNGRRALLQLERDAGELGDVGDLLPELCRRFAIVAGALPRLTGARRLPAW
jgi:hypothetical protein